MSYFTVEKFGSMWKLNQMSLGDWADIDLRDLVRKAKHSARHSVRHAVSCIKLYYSKTKRLLNGGGTFQ